MEQKVKFQFTRKREENSEFQGFQVKQNLDCILDTSNVFEFDKRIAKTNIL